MVIIDIAHNGRTRWRFERFLSIFGQHCFTTGNKLSENIEEDLACPFFAR